MKFRLLVFVIGCLLGLLLGRALSQEAHAWTLWSEYLGDVHKVSKVQVEDKCFYVFEGWDSRPHAGTSLVMQIVPSVCKGEKP